MRWYKRQMKKQAGRMLAIGDGANDVAMIQVCALLPSGSGACRGSRSLWPEAGSSQMSAA